MNTLKKLAGQTAVYGLSSVIGRLLNYLLVPLYTRCFLPEEYGVVTEVYAYVAFFVVFLTYGFETAFFRFSRKENTAKNVFSTALVSVFITSLFFMFLMVYYSNYFAGIIGYGIESRFIKWFAIILALDAISSIVFAKIRYEERAFKFAKIKLLGIFINILLNIYFIVYMNLGIEYIFISNLISSVCTSIVLLPEIIGIKLCFDKNLWKKMITYSIPLTIAGLAGITNETIDRVLLKHFLSEPITASYELGLYGAFYKLSIVMVLFVQTFRFAAEPFFFAQYKSSQNRRVYAEIMKYFVIVMIIIFLLAVILYDYLICFLGNSFHDERGFLVVSILLLANLFLGIYFNLSIWYKLTDKTIYAAYLAVFGAMITLALNITLIPKIGFLGSAFATLACYFSMATVSYCLGRRYFPVPYQTNRIIMYLALMISIFFIVYTQNFKLVVNSLFLLGFAIFVYLLESKKSVIR